MPDSGERKSPRRRSLVQARVSPRELASWRAKAAAAGVSSSALLRQAMARTGVWDPDGGRRRARAGARGRARADAGAGAHRKQPQPDRALGQRAQVGGRRRRGEPPPRGDRAGAAEPGPVRPAALMHLKFLARGTGSAAAAAAYLLAKRDAAGRERAAVEVLRGDPREVAAIADALPFKHRYTSGVVAWSRDDAPSPAQVERFVDAFEELAWAGLGKDRYAWSAVVHRDHEGGVHAHILAARCDLASGRSLNIAPAGVAEDFRPAARRLQLRARLEPPGRPGAGSCVPAGAVPGVSGRDGAAGRAGGRARPPAMDRGVPAGARDVGHGPGPGRGGGGAWGAGPGGYAAGPALRDRPSS